MLEPLLQYDYSLALQVFVIIFLALLLDLMSNRGLARLLRQAEKNAALWDDVVLHALLQPLRLLIWVIGLGLALHVINMERPGTLLDVTQPLPRVGALLALIWFFLRLTNGGERMFVERRKQGQETIDIDTVEAVAKLLRASIYITGALVILQSMGYSISGVLAFGGIGGIAVGFAARDLLANYFGGVMIYLDRPFGVGNWVRSPDREIEGIVEHIGWRLTRIRTFDKRPLYVPNALFNTITVENPSRMLNRRIYETIGIRYEDAPRMNEIINRVRAMLQNHEEIDQNSTLIVNFNSFAPSSLDFFLYTFTRTTDWVHFHAVKQDVLLRVLTIIEDCGAECAFPTSTLHLPDPLPIENRPG